MGSRNPERITVNFLRMVQVVELVAFGGIVEHQLHQIVQILPVLHIYCKFTQIYNIYQIQAEWNPWKNPGVMVSKPVWIKNQLSTSTGWPDFSPWTLWKSRISHPKLRNCNAVAAKQGQKNMSSLILEMGKPSRSVTWCQAFKKLILHGIIGGLEF